MSTLTFSLIQTDIHWEDKAANLKMFEQKIRSIKEKTEVIVLPEMFSTGFSMKPRELAEKMDGSTIQWMKNMAAEKNVILTGSLILEENGHYFNRMIWMLPNGEYGSYDKRHRFAYAGEDEAYTAGTGRLISSVKGWKINLLVCYDLRFPVWSRQNHSPEDNSPEYDVLIYSANWPDRRIIAWTTLLRARAIENQCFVIGVNRVGKDANDSQYPGKSTVIDPMGEILYEGKDEEEIFTIALEKSKLQNTREKFPFWKDADNFIIAADR